MSKLSKREIVLLFVLGCVLILGVGLSLWILPLQTELSALETERTTLQTEKMRIEMLVKNKDKLEASKDSAYEETKEAVSKISSKIEANTFDRLLSATLEKEGFSIISTSYSEPTAVAPSAIITDPKTQEYSLKELFDSFQAISTEETGEALTASNELLKMSISVVLEGDNAKVSNLIDALNKQNETLFVTAIQYENSDSLQQITVQVDYYYLDTVQS